jgi:UPF0755 protein
MRRRVVWSAAALAAALGLAAAAWLGFSLSPVGGAGGTVVVEVARGESLARIARELEAAGAVRSARSFALLARWRGLGASLRAGEYELERSLDAAAVLERIAAGRVRTHAVSLPEGLTAEEVAARLAERGLVEREAFLAFVRSADAAASLGVEGPSLEGYLFPETYRLARGLAPSEVAAAMVGQFLAVWEQIAPDARAAGLSMAKTVTLASIVEKETGAPAERPLIAAVFLNRLRRGMRLETDPSVIYGIAGFDGNLRRAHLEDDTNPYNTYRIAGLPPGPIANPGRDALVAVVRPAPSDYLYFVSRNDGTHQFSRTFDEHAAAVDRYQRLGARRNP